MAVVKDFSTIVKEMEDLYKLRLPQANRSSGSVIKEAFINAPASQIAFLHGSVAQAETARKVETASGSDLDDIANNFNVSRNEGIQSTGVVYLILPETFPSGQDVVVNDGQIVSTKGQRAVDFRIVGQVTLSVASASLYEANANRRSSELSKLGYPNAMYLASAPITAVNSGTTGNVGIGSIGVTTILGVNAVVNLEPTAGGTDAESDNSLRERIALAQVSLAIGTSDSYKATVLDNPNITSAFVISGGDPLMTRDGTIVDSEGNILQEGTGRAVDIWAKGTSLISNSESFVYTDITDLREGPVAAANQKVLGYTDVDEENPFALQPVNALTSVTGSESGANFVEATEVEDDEGNIILDGNYFLLKDINASNYFIVREVSTGRLKVARQLSSFSTRYALVQELITSDYANSAKGFDKLIWTSDRVSIVDETVTRSSTYGGADALLNTDVLDISAINEEVILTKEIITVGTDHVNITLKHKPIVSVQEVKHVRLGALFTPTIIDADAGTVQVTGKFIPQTGDLFQVTYTWDKGYIRNLEYFLVGDSTSWEQDVVEADKRDSSILITTRNLQTTNSLDKQPLTPTYLKTKLAGLEDRARATLIFKGNTASITEGEDSKVLEIHEQTIVLRKGVTIGSAVLQFEPDDPADIVIYRSTDVFKRNIVDERGSNTYDSETMVYGFAINTVLFDNFFSSTDSELEFVVSYEVDKPFTFQVSQNATSGRLGKILRVRNLSKGIEYNLLDYNLRTNLDDRRAIVDESLATNQFRLSELANQTIIEAGDKIRFKRLASSLHWTSKDDFENNVGDNLTPTIDTSKIFIEESGDMRLKSFTEQAADQSTIQVGGSISTDVAWSGSVEVLDDVLVEPGATLLLRPGTIVRVREESRVGKKLKIEVQGRMIVDAGASAENPVVFTSAASTKAPGDWEGIVFGEGSRSLDGTLVSSLTFTEVRYATNGVHIDGSNPRIRFCRLSKNLQRGLLYTAESEIVEDLVLRDGYGDLVGWTAQGKVTSPPDGQVNETRIPLLDSNGVPIKLMTSMGETPFGRTVPGLNTGLDDGLGADGIPGTADDGYGADGIPGTADDGSGADGLPASASIPTKQIIHFTSSTFTGSSDVLNPEGVTPRFKILVGGTELDVHTYSGGEGANWNVDKENAWIEYVGSEETFYLVLYQNNTTTDFFDSMPISFSYAAPKDCGLAYQNIIEENITTGASINANVNLIIAGSTFYKNGASCIDAKDCYLTIRNNFLQEYSITPLSFDFKVMAKVNQNNAWSSIVEGEILNVPTNRIVLASDIDATQTIIDFTSYDLSVQYRSGQIIKINNEKMKIKAVTNTTGILSVIRGIQGTIPTTHRRGTTALLYGDRALFLVTGIPGTRCEVIATDVQGNVLVDRAPLQMTKLADGTFTVSVVLDRSENFNYRYRYLSPENNIVLLLSKMRTLRSKGTSIGDTAVDVFSPIHEAYYFKNTNYAIDPQFRDPIHGNFEIDSTSPSHKDNELYAPEVLVYSDYLGRERIQEIKNFTADDISDAGGSITTLVLSYDVVIESSVRLDVEIFVPTGVSSVYAFGYNSESKTVTLDTLTPITTPGTYLIQYFKPVSLGSTLPGYNYAGEATYIVDAKQIVDFTDLTFARNDSGGGAITFQFRSPDSSIENQQITDLATAAFGPVYDTSPIRLTDFRDVEGGPIESQYLEIKLRIRSNWKGFDATDVALFPILEDMTLSFTPAKDEQIYDVKSATYRPTTDRTEFSIVLEGTNDTGITESTFRNVGSDERINVLVYNSTKNDFDSVAIAMRLTLGTTTIETIGNLTEVFEAPRSADIYLVDYMWITQNDQEQMIFVEDAEQTTEKRFVSVSTIIASIIKDRLVLLPEDEELTLNSTSEPEAGAVYEADYEYVAPKENEVIETSYSYNDAIRSSASDVEDNKDLIASVLVREAIDVAIRIEAELEVLPGEVYADVTAAAGVAIASYFDGFTIGETSKIDQSDIVTVIGNVDGVDSVKLTVFNYSPLSGVVESVTLERNEVPVLADGSPEFSRPSDTANII